MQIKQSKCKVKKLKFKIRKEWEDGKEENEKKERGGEEINTSILIARK